MKQFENLADAQTLALAIVDTFPEPFLVLDAQFCVLAASRCFYEVFKEDPERTHGHPFFALGEGRWDVAALRRGLKAVLRDHAPMDGLELTHDCPGLGMRVMLLSARLVRYEDSSSPTLLLAFKDITERRLVERENRRCWSIPRNCSPSTRRCSARWSIASPTASRSLPASCS